MIPVCHTRALLPIALLASLLCLSAPLSAREGAANLQEAIAQVQRETGGRVLSADTVATGTREVYRIKVLTPDGRVRVVTRPSRVGNNR